MNGACLNSKWRSDKKCLQIIHIFLWPVFLPTIRSVELPRAFMTRALFHCAAIRFEGLLSCVVCARKLIIRAENSSFVGKLTAVSSETSRWRSVLRSEATVNFNVRKQRTKKVVSDSPGIVDSAIELVNSVLNLPDGQVKFFEEFKLQKNCVINPVYQKVFGASWNAFWASKC